ncbi:MAG: isocitrate lyase/phosphoenolpyruvate mutase family protein [Chloroflexi bacterium]|nr:isocitrate lyase/phosphoenolpyruvate mutase family protein [Chloroflexota bacterium]MDA1173287.1 isocitrate lyase/phosphoenolpyruvate mutase family protein [Chloroflexota bacterium]
MRVSERRQRVRDHFAGNECVRPASIFDPISSRIATDLGFSFGMLGGSIASHTVLGAPDLAVITLTELAEQCRRITRASDISLIVDADHGYGNALSVMRTIDELETAGVAAMTIEDTILPQRFGHQGQEELIPINEMVGKLQAAVAARQDATTVIIGRTHSLNATNQDDAIERVKAFDATGVDAIFLLGIKEVGQLEAIRKVTALPFMLGTVAEALDNATLAPYGVKMALRGHGTFNAAVKAIYDSLKHQADGGKPSEVVGTQADADLMGLAIGSASYKEWRGAFLSE